MTYHHLLAFDIGNQINLGNDNKLNSSQYKSVSPLITALLQNALMLAGVLLLCLLLFGGITLIISAGKGDPKKAGQGKSAITSALIGFLIIFLSYSIIKAIEFITGLNILSNPTS